MEDNKPQNPKFQSAYNQLISCIEKEFDIDLTLGEKVSLKKYLECAQTTLGERTLKENVGITQMFEAELMWARQYGISRQELIGVIEVMPPWFKEYFQLMRDECLLI